MVREGNAQRLASLAFNPLDRPREQAKVELLPCGVELTIVAVSILEEAIVAAPFAGDRANGEEARTSGHLLPEAARCGPKHLPIALRSGPDPAVGIGPTAFRA